ncbi:receptor protein kinase [Spatholobus suberectus]|nr:receptor protein kinase [Spatholobus suberectus]
MIDWRNIGFFICALSILPLVCFCATFVPVDDYLIDCGAPASTSVGGRNFTADNLSKDLLSTQEDILATTSLKSNISSSDDSPLYQTARIFTGSSKYTFPIKQMGRHWIRLYFFHLLIKNTI